MGKLVCHARQIRLNYQQRIGRVVSIQEVADAVGMTRAALSNIESGKSLPSPDTIVRLCDFYGVTVGELLEHIPESASGNSLPVLQRAA